MTQKDYNLEEIKTLEEKLLNPLIRKSSIEVSKLLADDFIEYGSSGLIYNKQIVINDLQSECPINFGTRDFKIKKLATDVILATYIAVKYNDAGIEESSSLRSSIWKLNDGNWQMIFHQGTKIFDDVYQFMRSFLIVEIESGIGFGIEYSQLYKNWSEDFWRVKE